MSPSATDIFAAAVIAALIWMIGNLRRTKGPKAPPGPRPLPIIGNLHMMGSLPHKTLFDLSKKYGPIMSVRLGLVPTVVVTSPDAAELFLKTQDLAFASRPRSLLSDRLYYGTTGVGLCPYGEYWRSARKLVVVKLLNSAKTEAVGELRMRELDSMVRSLRQSADARQIVDLSAALGKSFEATTYQMVFGKGRNETFGIKEITEEILNLAGEFDLAEFIPFLRPFDPTGLSRRLNQASRNFDRVLEAMMDEYLREGSTILHEDDVTKGFLGILLSRLHQPLGSDVDGLRIDRNIIKGLLLDILIAAIDTSFTTIEWGMSELIRHPRVMKKLQDELARVVGLGRNVEFSDFPHLPYLDMVVKETFRLHPPAPLLVPHESIQDATVGGYFIPKNTRILIHAWAIGRDPNAWPHHTEEFYPEKFEGSDVDIQGRDYQLLPFGSGRRSCPAWRMGLYAVTTALAQLPHCFDWELTGGAPLSELDMTEKFGLTVSRANHILAVPHYRLRY